MSTPKVFDVCVVGAGLWGSAAAKYCSEQEGIAVCLVGPSEPTTVEDRESRFIFGAHYDEGRICGAISTNVEWGQLARRSAENYTNIEQLTDVQFYKDVGLLWMTVRGGALSQSLLDATKQTETAVQVLDNSELIQRFSFLSLENIPTEKKNEFEIIGFLQQADAGHINPRKLVHAQQIIARRQGCQIFDDIVKEVIHNESLGMFEVATEGGKTVNAKKVLLCTGASTAFEHFLPNELQLDITSKTQEVVLMELTENDREMLRDMPSILVHEGERDLGRDCYILPPIKYPDGKCYLKIGHGKMGEDDVTSKEQLKAWYCGQGITCTSERLVGLMRDIFPGLKPLSMHTDTCVTVSTPTTQLYCDMVTPRLGVLVGGNGCGAKSSDEIGRMGANMILRGEWDYDLPMEKFRAQWKPKTEELSSK